MDFKRVVKFGVVGLTGVALVATVAGLVGAAAGVALIRNTYNGPTEQGGQHFVDVDSEILGHSVRLDIHRPVGLNPASGDPVHLLWMLDGPSRSPRAASASDDLARIGRIPATIVVSVPASAAGRTADFTPPGLSVSGIDGRADRFLEFLTEEAKPAVHEALTGEVSTELIAGHSLGGLFVGYAMTVNPERFDGWFAFSPSWWVDGRSPVRSLDEWLASQAALSTVFHATLGEEESSGMQAGFAAAREAFATDVPEGFRWKAELVEGANHGNNPDLSIARALDAFWMERGVR